MKLTTECKYSCPACGLFDIAVDVTAREPDQDVVEWAEKTMIVELSDDHHRRSPHCSPKELKNIKIPIADDRPPGAPARH